MGKKILFRLAIASLYLGACSNRPSLTTNTYSSQLDDHKKIEFLSRYLNLLSPIEATEFHINVHDNSSNFIAAPSDWDIEAVIKVSPSNLKLWTEEMRLQQQPVDITWGHNLISKDKQRWIVKSKPKIYQRLKGDGLVVVFETEGIIFKNYHAH